MNELALFAGAGGGLQASRYLRWNTLCAVEINEYARQILFQRQHDNLLNKFPIWDDIRTFNGKEWQGRIDILTGGFPCQHFSTASRGHKTAIDLWPQMARVISEVRPRNVFCENVSESAILKAGLDLWCQGYSFRYTKVSAKDVGADHLRERWWLFAYSDNQSELSKQKYAKMEMLQKLCESFWESPPGKPRMADGMARRVDRFRAIGNGQMPLVFLKAWGILTSYPFT